MTTLQVAAVRELAERLCREFASLGAQVARVAGDVESAFVEERTAKRQLVLDVLDAVRPALGWIAEHEGAVSGVPGSDVYRQVTIDVWTDCRKPEESYDWIAFDHPDLGVVVARKRVAHMAELVWPDRDLPLGRDGGPRLEEVLERLADRLSAQLRGNAARKRRDANNMLARIQAIQVLLRAGK